MFRFHKIDIEGPKVWYLEHYSKGFNMSIVHHRLKTKYKFYVCKYKASELIECSITAIKKDYTEICLFKDSKTWDDGIFVDVKNPNGLTQSYLTDSISEDNKLVAREIQYNIIKEIKTCIEMIKSRWEYDTDMMILLESLIEILENPVLLNTKEKMEKHLVLFLDKLLIRMDLLKKEKTTIGLTNIVK